MGCLVELEVDWVMAFVGIVPLVVCESLIDQWRVIFLKIVEVGW